jgi:aspartate ammonia-lyase
MMVFVNEAYKADKIYVGFLEGLVKLLSPVCPHLGEELWQILGHDTTIAMAAEAGQLELNAFEPVVFYQLFESITVLTHAVTTLIDNCIKGITANSDHCEELEEGSVGIATALSPILGYQKSASIAKQALHEEKTIREIVLEQKLMDPEKLDVILDPISMVGMIRSA